MRSNPDAGKRMVAYLRGEKDIDDLKKVPARPERKKEEK